MPDGSRSGRSGLLTLNQRQPQRRPLRRAFEAVDVPADLEPRLGDLLMDQPDRSTRDQGSSVRLRAPRVWNHLMMTTPLLGLRTVIYPSPDLEASKTWWTNLLGVDPYFDQPFYVGFNVAGYELGLLPTADPEDGALVYWGVADVAEAVTESIAHGSAEHTPVADVGDDIVTATVRTPHGTIVGFISNPHFSAS